MRIGGDGSTVDEYDTLINPMRDIGPTDRHGIAHEDVAHAPTFAEALGDVLSRLAGVIFVGHNARFDRDFLAAELTSAADLPPGDPVVVHTQARLSATPGAYEPPARNVL